MKETSDSRFRESRFREAEEGEVVAEGEGTKMSTIWGLPTMMKLTTLAVSSWDFLLDAGEDTLASPSSTFPSSKSERVSS